MTSTTSTAKPLTVVIPAYNEEKTVAQVIEAVLQVDLVGEVIVVDDCSKDKTAEIVSKISESEPAVHLLRHEVNQGKGAALRTGFQGATLPYVIVQDADLEYDPNEFELVVTPLIEGKCDVCYGSRYLRDNPRRVLRFWHTMGNRFLTTLSNMATDLYVTDMETCYKAFKREVIQNIEVEENRFGFEPEITAKIARRRLRVMEVAISYYPRSFSEGKHIGWKDGVRAIYCIFKYGIWRRNKNVMVLDNNGQLSVAER
ncbi:Glycosyltransferase involved in cell wall bisynthesis [Rubritalea squalenifaciens DSM 18772]|uniref:Glycosyltransferase involved in cell wall bisynthesis n=2 Tax=Rubritalea TaxID=361050 RepID=A0A1M6IJV1_9BACT|nr:glycosyltransferase family 2 protein [Rubritalea squalenifaciens]SHJ34761.1 Glycosyltransferase involved in cell wall bisynthesis [Rubritalea squalenifaciens DSM 18772]